MAPKFYSEFLQFSGLFCFTPGQQYRYHWSSLTKSFVSGDYGYVIIMYLKTQLFCSLGFYFFVLFCFVKVVKINGLW